VKLKEKKKI